MQAGSVAAQHSHDDLVGSKHRSRASKKAHLRRASGKRVTIAADRDGSVRPVLGGVLALAAAMGIGRFAYTPILPAMQNAGLLTTAQAGLLAAANYAGYLAGALLVAGALHRTAPVPALRAFTLAVATTTALMSVTTGLAAWSMVRFAAGVASAGVFVLASGLVLDELQRLGKGARSGWLFSGPGLGIVLSGLVVHVAGSSLSWRGDWAVLALIAAVAIMPCWRWSTPTPILAPFPPGNPNLETSRAARRVVGLLFAAYTLEGIGYIVTGTFLPTIVERAPGSRGLGAAVWIVVGLAAMPAGVVWAAVGERTGYPRALAGAFLLQASGIMLPLLGGVIPAIGAAILFGGTFIGITTLTITLAGRLAPTASARLIARLTAAYGVSQMTGPVLAGLVAGRSDNFGPALTGASVLVLVGGVLMLRLARIDPSAGFAGQ
jgi:predicted MFS family arabinose efflux permease